MSHGATPIVELRELTKRYGEVEALRGISLAIAATQRHPKRDILIVDCGTATTFDVITATGEYLGGAILPGVGVSLEALASHTAKLPRVELARPTGALGRSTVESIQSGVFHGQVGAIRQLIGVLSREAFASDPPRVIGTGGYASALLRQQSRSSAVSQ